MALDRAAATCARIPAHTSRLTPACLSGPVRPWCAPRHRQHHAWPRRRDGGSFGWRRCVPRGGSDLSATASRTAAVASIRKPPSTCKTYVHETAATAGPAPVALASDRRRVAMGCGSDRVPIVSCCMHVCGLRCGRADVHRRATCFSRDVWCQESFWEERLRKGKKMPGISSEDMV